MAFDGNGNWIPEFSAKEDRDAGVKILAGRFDDVFQQDLKESFEKCLTNDGQSRPLQDFNFNNHRGINVADPETDSDVVNLRKLTNTIDATISALYPVGSLYIGIQEVCPLESLIAGSTWELVAQDRALWGADGTNANTTIEAGLPDIAGNVGGVDRVGSGQSGPFYTDGTGPNGSGTTTSNNWENIKFALSKANSIYGNSKTVQPPAYRVNIWRRTE